MKPCSKVPPVPPAEDLDEVMARHEEPSLRQNNPPLTPAMLGFTKAAYSVSETLNLLSIGRTSLYALVKSGDLKPGKLGKKTLFYSPDLAAL
jgi:hypothetical protein